MTIVKTPTPEETAVHNVEYLFGRPLPECPRCGSRRLETVVEDVLQEVNFYCLACDRCWRVELGFAQPIPPAVCVHAESVSGMTQLAIPRAHARMPDGAHDPADVAGIKALEMPSETASDSCSRKSQAKGLVALADGRRESLEQRRAYFQKRLHQASNDLAATEGLRVVEAALRLIPQAAAAPQI
jgi:hypothetical protein